jgi:hypothetical protein
MDDVSELGVSSEVTETKILAAVGGDLRDLWERCCKEIGDWDRALEREIAGLARLPLMTKCRELRARQAAAKTEIARLDGEIARARETLTTVDPAGLGAAVEKASGAIAEFDRKRSAAKLIADTCESQIDAMLPAREAAVKEALHSLLNDVNQRVAAEIEAERAKFARVLLSKAGPLAVASWKPTRIFTNSGLTADVIEEWAIEQKIVGGNS